MTRSLPLPARIDENEFRVLVEAARQGPWPADEVARLGGALGCERRAGRLDRLVEDC